MQKIKAKIKMPDTSVILILMILFMALLTYIIPAGEFERVIDEATGRLVVEAGTYSQIDSNPTTLFGLFSSVYRGLIKASDIISFVLVVGGSFGIVSKTNAITVALEKLIQKFHGNENILILILMTAFAICGTTFGMSAEALPFVIIIVIAARKMGYDSIVGVSVVVVGIYCGYSSGILNPFNTGIAQEIAQLPMFSGIGLRTVFMIGAIAIAYQHTIAYGKKYKKSGVATQEDIEMQIANVQLTKKDIAILCTLLLTIICLIFGVLKFGWYMQEISALFFVMGLISGVIYYNGKVESIMKAFLEGVKDMSTIIIYVGLSRSILLILEDACVMDTIVYYLSLPLEKTSKVVSAIGIYFSQGILNFFIPSSSGQAVVIMPIITPLSDIVGITRQTGVLAFQAGDGFWNMITPTHSMLMAALGIAGVSFEKWFKFALPLVIKWSAWVCVVLCYAVLTGWGPF